MALILPSRFTRQPQQYAPIDAGNPFAQAAQLLVSGGVSLNSVNGRKPDLQVGTKAPGFGRFGRFDSAYSGGTDTLRDDQYSLASSTDFAVLAVVDHSASSGSTVPILGGDGSSGGRAFQFRFTASNTLEFIRFNAAVSNFSCSVAAASRSGTVLAVSIGNTFWVYFGGASATGTITGTPQPISRVSIGGGFGFDSAVFPDDKLFMAAVLKGSAANVSPEELLANPWQLFKAPARQLYVVAATGGASDAPINPGSGSLALTGYAPAITQSAHQSIESASGSIAITGYAPTVAQSAIQAVTPGAGSIAITGYAPTITQSIAARINPGTGSLTLTGYAPAVEQSAHQAIAPAAGSLTIAGYAPSITQESASRNIEPGAGSLVITGYAPSIAQSGQESQNAGGIAWLNGYGRTHNRKRRRHEDDEEAAEVESGIVEVAPPKPPSLQMIRKAYAIEESQQLEIRIRSDATRKRRAKEAADAEDEDDVMLLLMQ